ncbi:hypothetical protein AMAG_14769 [Allomyces macrogynus ATCC 38327]|uniref:Uncharacterized protein n=1 Tax=Allomyces macrogynus (strain ATCC 38327) TaxID=578462 RepID=A0A0L0T5A6_ALLM3|nr:hypothetical protein AMAG_14769 [Allomyces macrogynus ATCC 38327]|eukprot:KNE69922.1 hypothetical protein AMAG_14769 [Allomyces macrogynus ATCC 38327]
MAEYCLVLGWSVPGVPRHTHVHARFDSAQKHIIWQPPAATTSADSPAGGACAAESVNAATHTDLDALFALLPPHIHDAVTALANVYTDLSEFFVDLGWLRYFGFCEIDLDVLGVTAADLHAVYGRRTWSSDWHGGIEGMWHRISWIAGRENEVVGLTIRIGRGCPLGQGAVQIVQDLVEAGDNSRSSSRPCKTTPDMVVIDGISDAREVAAARSVTTLIRGMVATAHGTLDSILRNWAMRNIVGGFLTVTVGDEVANRDLAVRKGITQCAADATFTTVVELLSRTEVRVLRNMNRVVDAILKPDATV